MLKVLIDIAIIALIGYLVYVKFFKKSKKDSGESNAMIGCESCGIFIEQKDSIKQNDKLYCSESCARKGVEK